MNQLIYNFSEHGLYYERHIESTKNEITLTIGSIQLEFDYDTGELLSIIGYLPLMKAEIGKLSIPTYSDEIHLFKMGDIVNHKGVVYDLFDIYPESKKYFMNDEYNPKLVFDEEGKRILVGTAEEGNLYIKINDNIICGFDENTCTFKSILIMIDKIKK